MWHRTAYPAQQLYTNVLESCARLRKVGAASSKVQAPYLSTALVDLSAWYDALVHDQKRGAFLWAGVAKAHLLMHSYLLSTSHIEVIGPLQNIRVLP